jgi:hypothetical protein
MNRSDELIGLWSNIIGLSFVLSLEQISSEILPEPDRARYRPGQIAIEHPRFTSFIAISWIGEGKFKQTLSLKHQGKVAPADISV